MLLFCGLLCSFVCLCFHDLFAMLCFLLLSYYSDVFGKFVIPINNIFFVIVLDSNCSMFVA